ncbi:neuraminidase-like domain-containing protein [Xenorhabdus sp. XENO-7]|uniref:Neuraminidase-like domain-containing protein n=1 Tax=Xenorhabdus aichiensis TaxID=3025874 RepID=A0ABT5M103_9GAMM|nr:neuraminidase-like domain-containing protein [Xenorhabdus aichiensis]MDC9620635.1 neuraminidase-like domain-containing protein [Xenorhabdus aichiensis]
MYNTDKLLDKLNRGIKDTDAQPATLPDIMGLSFAELQALAGDSLSWDEKHFLYQQAQQALKENRMAESRILSRANPQLANAVRLGIRQSSLQRSYDDLFGGRASKFVKPGSVASMFSPAGYLTELYREARNLHAATSAYHLDKRRPDLASLSLSQNNMDDELSTLSLSNELLLNNIQAQENRDYDGVLEVLATYRQTGMTPFHLPYETCRQAVMQQDEELVAFQRNPDVAAQMDTTSMLAIKNGISPELYNILTEEITEANAEELIIKNFGENIVIEHFKDMDYLAHYYGLTHDEISTALDFLIVGDGVDADRQHYRNNRLFALVDSGNGEREIVVITRKYKQPYKLDYLEVIPLGNGFCQINVSYRSYNKKFNQLWIGTGDTISPRNNLVDEEIKDFRPHIPNSYVVEFSFDEKEFKIWTGHADLKEGFCNIKGRLTFTIDSWPYHIYLLKLNKLIRLYKATGISLSDIHAVIDNHNNNLSVNDDVLSQLFWVQHYMQRYGINVSSALVLAGSVISQISHNGQPDAFTRLFNTPPLNGQTFYADGATIKLTPTEVTDSFRTGVMKRAFQVNDAELTTLWNLAQGSATPPAFTCTLEHLSLLYRVKLLADAHGLSVTELGMLLSVSPYATTRIAGLSGTALSELVGFLALYTQWLTVQGWTVSELYLMTTDRYSTARSPEIENLVTTLRDGIAGLEPERLNETALIEAAAPYIAAATRLDSAELATAVLLWLDQLKPQKLTVKTFLALVNKTSLTPDESIRLVTFCQVTGQLALLVRSLGLTPGELSLAVTQPGSLIAGVKSLPQNIATIRALANFHHWLQRCGVSATEMLAALGNGALTPAQLAQAMTLDEQIVIQGLIQHDNQAVVFSGWPAIDVTLQWIDMATALGITPAGVAALMSLKYTDPAQRPSYRDWVAISHTLQSGLNSRQTRQLQTTVDEALGTALSAYVIKNTAPSWVSDRDQLYSWLLLDNQVSAQVKTTRLAEAIAGVQLYVNRALSGQEEDVEYTVKSRQFFTDWDTYNKRYSTWVGVSQLAYYPENYIDPTVRLGQTGMMDEMLQTLSQSQLNRDTVEGAFKTYMTRFEDIANLDVISGYHDSVSDQDGLTYLLGRSDIGDYYWRSANIGMLSGGKLPANAWREWKKITVAVSAVNNLVRPVVFQSRLYIVWVESKEVSTTSSTPTLFVECTLKYAHILHDGSWSAPVSVSLKAGTLPLNNVDIDHTGMYCARDVGQETLYVYFYKKQATYNNIPTSISGVTIQPDGSVKDVTGNISSENVGYIYKQMDTLTEVRFNTLYMHGETHISISAPKKTDFEWGAGQFSRFSNGEVASLTAAISGDKVILSFMARTNLLFQPPKGSRAEKQIRIMKEIGLQTGEFFLADSCITSYVGVAEVVTAPVGPNAYNVYIWCSEGYLYLDNGPFYLDRYYRWDRTSYPTTRMENTTETIWVSERDNYGTSPEVVFVDRVNPFYPIQPNFEFTDFKRFSTQISDNGVSLTVSGGAKGYFDKPSRAPLLDEVRFEFNAGSVNIPLRDFDNQKNHSLAIDFTFSGKTVDGRKLGREGIQVTLTKGVTSSLPIISLHRTASYAQYLQYGVYRTRVNTLFAKQLVARASHGLNSVLSMTTQQLQEPQLGKGFYADFVLPPYDKKVHGNSRAFTLNLKHVVDNDAHIIYSGMLSGHTLPVRVFVPLDETPLNQDYIAKVFLRTEKQGDGTGKGAHFSYANSAKTAVKLNEKNNDISMFSDVLIRNGQTTEPMDFNGANALYFWEMFYYVPMMAFRRLLQENCFSDATQWIKYIWSPEGYMLDGQPAPYQWNVRPLEEETTWNANPLDSVDPDAVAQADPMHYKVATFMALMDLLLARGDAAYRQLERDTLNEAKMWYVQALSLLGDEPFLPTGGNYWSNPSLREAADPARQLRSRQALEAVRWQTAEREGDTANSLTDLFLPSQNTRLAGYWQTLAQRLYNLRHNLSIDGLPLSVEIYAASADPSALLSAAVNTSQGSRTLPHAVMPLYRFPVMLESARSMVSQLMQFGATLLGITERQDAEALAELLQTQGAELVLQSLTQQEKTLAEIDADQSALEESRRGAQSRLDSYTALYDEDVNTIEKQVMDLYTRSSAIAAGAEALFMAGAALDMVPNIYGMAVGGSRFGALSNAFGIGTRIASDTTRIKADHLGQSETYRRRRQEWEILRNNAASEVKQIDASLTALAVRREAAVLQKTYLETQQNQAQAQLAFLQNKFTNKALYNWLRGKLSAIYYQFYDLTVSRCLMAQEAYQWALDLDSATFIRPGAWQGNYAGLMAGETLMLSLAQMEQAYLQKDQREKEVTRTVCLSAVYAELPGGGFALADKLSELISAGKGSAGTDENGLKVEGNRLRATLKLSGLNIRRDYPEELGKNRRIRQISVTLPALVGPYQDVRAMLSYGGSVVMPRGCNAIALSHDMNDSGQFQLDFNDSRWLPFEGIPVDDTGTLVLSFPDATDRQQTLLQSLNDIILHIRYTIRS